MEYACIQDPVAASGGAPASTPTTPPSEAPTFTPSSEPAAPPSEGPAPTPPSPPSEGPASTPTSSPSEVPALTTTSPPTRSPTDSPTAPPSSAPTVQPSAVPTSAPSSPPSSFPARSPGTVYWVVNGRIPETSISHRSMNGLPLLALATGIKKIAAGYDHALLLAANGTVFGWGSNSYLQLGTGISRSSLWGTVKKIAEDAVDVEAGDRRSFILFRNHSLYRIDKSSGKWYPHWTDSVKAVSIGNRDQSNSAYFLYVTDNGMVYANHIGGYGTYVMDDAKAVQAGYHYAFILANNGTVYAIGSCNYGRCGHVEGNSQVPRQVMTGIQSMACGKDHSLLLSSNGTLYGAGKAGQHSGYLGQRIGCKDMWTFCVIATGVKTVGAYHRTTYYVTFDGALYGMGTLGYDDHNDEWVNAFSPIKVMSGMQSVSLGNDFFWLTE